MDELKFEVLETLYKSPNHQARRPDILNEYLNDLKYANTILNDLINSKPQLVDKGVGSDNLRLTSHGILAYEAEYEKRRSSTENKRANRQNKIIAIVSLCIAGATFVVVLIDFIKQFL